LNDVRDKCFDAGMDAFLVKPFDDRELAETLSRWLEPRRTNGRDGHAEQGSAITMRPQDTKSAVIDMNVLDRLRTLGRPNGSSPLERAVAHFLGIAPSLAGAIRANFEAGDAEELARAAHSLKSSAGALGAIQLSKVCAQIESLARQSNFAAVRPLMEELDHGVTAALDQLAAIAGGMHAVA
jgi:HPt (histidine-containing phosphotransfer) domain-containing protein